MKRRSSEPTSTHSRRLDGKPQSSLLVSLLVESTRSRYHTDGVMRYGRQYGVVRFDVAPYRQCTVAPQREILCGPPSQKVPGSHPCVEPFSNNNNNKKYFLIMGWDILLPLKRQHIPLHEVRMKLYDAEEHRPTICRLNPGAVLKRTV